MIIAKGSNNDIPLAPAGMIQAVCYAVWDIGKQKVTWQGVDKMVDKAVIAWEINEIIKDTGTEYDGKRFVISNRYTLSLGSKAILRAHLASWRGKDFTQEELQGFDIEKLIRVNCMLNVVHNDNNGRTYANVQAVTPPLKGMQPMVPENESKEPEWVLKLKGNQQDPFQAPGQFEGQEPPTFQGNTDLSF